MTLDEAIDEAMSRISFYDVNESRRYIMGQTIYGVIYKKTFKVTHEKICQEMLVTLEKAIANVIFWYIEGAVVEATKDELE